MGGNQQAEAHSAEGVALGFWYQAVYALLTLVAQTTDDAAIGVEQLDDVELKADGHTLLYQLKHSISKIPPPISIKSRSLWRTVKVWADALPSLTLAETTLYLVTVGSIAADDELQILTSEKGDRESLVVAMTKEAKKIEEAREIAAKNGEKLPYADRADGCIAFLSMSEAERLNLLRRTRIRPDSPKISEVEGEIAGCLHILPVGQRLAVAGRLIEWWDRQILYSLCGERDRIIARSELQAQISAIVADLEQGKLIPEFEMINHPEDYQPDGMLARQIELVGGKSSDIGKAIREEWRAREQRSRWIANTPAMAATINDYDLVLREYWSDRHSRLVEDCAALEPGEKCEAGLKLLRWSHDDAPVTIPPIAEGWGAAYYVRGSYQVLAINLKVGWHPDYEFLLGCTK